MALFPHVSQSLLEIQVAVAIAVAVAGVIISKIAQNLAVQSRDE